VSTESEASRIEGLIDSAQFSKALWLLRDAFARNPGAATLLKLAEKLAQAAESRVQDLESSRATEGSRHAREIAVIAKEARDYLAG